MDLYSQTKKPSVKDFAGSFFSAASVFSKKLQKWKQKQKVKKPRNGVGGGRPQSEIGVGRRSSDTDPDLDTGSGHNSGSKTPGLTYTPFRKNPNVSNKAFLEYYYLNLRRIYVGRKHVKIPYKYLAPGTNGDGGSIVDSGSTFTFMERPVFELVAEEFASQMSNYTREKDLEKETGLGPCFNISGKGDVTVPELIFEFKGGAKLELPLSNYFTFVGNTDTVCLTVVSDKTVNPSGGTGPAIILGSFQQQNYLVEYDLENDRFGFAKKKCSP